MPPAQIAGLAGAISIALLHPLAADGSPAETAEIPEGRSRLGPLWVSDAGRKSVRGFRAENASIHVAYSPAGSDPDRTLRKHLAEFERAAFPMHASGQPRQTIVDEPPEPWMRELLLPDLPVRWNRKTVEYLHYFKDDPRGRSLMRAWLSRMGRYEQEVGRIFDEVGVPRDLIFVALVESGFRPGNTNSLTGAAGMWQFMEPTGRVYGLMSDYWSDDRYDYVKATYAAAAYFKDLEVRFGSWEMALAGYNAGYGLLMKTIRRNNTNNYWALCEIESGLPYQTTNYVPKLVAAAIVARNRAAFGLGDVEVKAPAVLVDVKVPASTRIKDLADQLDVDEDLLAEFNARWLRGRTPPKGGPFTIRIPADKLAKFEALALDAGPAGQPAVTHTVRLGEDLGSIAREYGVTEKHLRRVNGVRDSAEVHEGITLVVPGPADPAAVGAAPAPPLAAVPPVVVPAGSRLVFLRTTRATTPRRVASAFGIRWDQVVAWNDLDPRARIQDGLFLQLVVPADFDAAAAKVRVYEASEAVHVIRGTREHLDAMLAERDLLRRGYKARKGDTFKKIAKRFKTSVGSLARINRLRRSHQPKPGELVIVYVEKGKTKGTVAAPDPDPTAITAELAAIADGEGIPGSKRPPSKAETARVPGQPRPKGPSK